MSILQRERGTGEGMIYSVAWYFSCLTNVLESGAVDPAELVHPGPFILLTGKVLAWASKGGPTVTCYQAKRFHSLKLKET